MQTAAAQRLPTGRGAAQRSPNVRRRSGLTVRAAAAGLSNDSGAESPVGQQFVKSVLAVGAASILAASGVQTVRAGVAERRNPRRT